MATLAETVTRVCDDLSRPESEISDVVEREILSAIRFYENRRLGFNERILTATISATYSYAFSSLIANDTEVEDIFAIDQIKVTYAGREYTLEQEPWSIIFDQDMLGITANLPDYWAAFNKSLRLYPAPSSSLDAQITAHVRLITAKWLDEGEELIRSRATKNVLGRKLYDYEGAQYYQGLENEALRSLMHDAAVRRSTGTLRPND